MYISEIRREKRDRLLILTDEAGCFPLYEREAAEYHLEEDSVLSDADWERLCDEILKPRVIRRAIFLLQRMDRTEYQLRQRLSQDHYPDFLIDAAMDYVKSFHYLDDLRYASSYIRFHQSEKSCLQLRIALQRRGVPAALIEQAM
ncbi:MAG: RecX family transcriptional regulator, partial [Clostridiales bacterium]|nr:RecX family transcriptional regulator [Clostridiales bacterium]